MHFIAKNEKKVSGFSRLKSIWGRLPAHRMFVFRGSGRDEGGCHVGPLARRGVFACAVCLIRRHRARRTHWRAPDAVLTVLFIITRGALRLTNIVFWDGVPIGRTLTVFATTTRWQTKAEVASTATMLADGSSDEDSSACVYEGSSG